MYIFLQETRIIIIIMLDGHSREDTNASCYRDFADNVFSEKIHDQNHIYMCTVLL